jgi:hypothetical protein
VDVVSSAGVASRAGLPVQAGATAEPGAAQHRRIRRLFVVLDDVARYAAGNASTAMLAHTWDRISDLLVSTDDLLLRASVRRVSEHEPGSQLWWAAIRAVASRYLRSAGGGG